MSLIGHGVLVSFGLRGLCRLHFGLLAWSCLSCFVSPLRVLPSLYSLLEDSLLPGLSFRFDFRSGWSDLLCHRLIGKFEIISAVICLRLCSLVSVCCSFSIAVEFHFRQNQIGFEVTGH
jgi:hypothetical protein